MSKLWGWLLGIVAVVVLCVVAINFEASSEHYDLSVNIVVGQAERACMEDEVKCHVGYDMFQSVQDAQDYLNSGWHLQAVKIRELKASQDAAASKAASAAIENAKHRKLHHSVHDLH
jgi:hypothetical protein